MRRISKREMQFRFGMTGETKVRIDRLEGRHAVAVLEGVECRLDLFHAAHQSLNSTGPIRAHVVSCPDRQGDGFLPKGTKRTGDEIDGLRRGPRGNRVCLDSDGLHASSAIRAHEEFLQDHPVGSLIEAEVLAVQRNKIRLALEGGLRTTMPMSDYWHRWPACSVEEGGRRPIPDRIEVIIRQVDPQRHVIKVTMHGYPRDPDYCNSCSGYRHAYDACAGLFRVLPWQRNEESASGNQ